jgi:hypothetical protein
LYFIEYKTCELQLYFEMPKKIDFLLKKTLEIEGGYRLVFTPFDEYFNFVLTLLMYFLYINTFCVLKTGLDSMSIFFEK